MAALLHFWKIAAVQQSTPLRTFGKRLINYKMSIENLLLTIEGSMTIGAVVGLLIGIFVPRPKVGCVILLIVPVAMILFESWWQSQHPENLRSTSGLDFVLGPLWPSLGAIGAYFLGIWVRSLFDRDV